VGVQFLLSWIAPSSTQTLLLDGVDKTAESSEWELMVSPVLATIMYTPAADLPLPLGPHQAEFIYESMEGPRTEIWNFTVADVPCDPAAVAVESAGAATAAGGLANDVPAESTSSSPADGDTTISDYSKYRPPWRVEALR
jgi:hypothetical protein